MSDKGNPLLGWLVFGLGLAGCQGNPNPQPKPDTAHDSVREVFRFVDVTSATGIEFAHRAGGAEEYFFPAIMAPGGAYFDFDRDGDLDILLVDSGDPPDLAATQPRNTTAACRLFRQEPNLRFIDVSSTSGLVLHGYGMGVAVADVTNDGLPDVYFTCFGPDQLFVNRGDGSFRDVSVEAGIDNSRWGTSAAFFDYDRDGWLDLFVVNYVDYDPALPCRVNSGQRDFCNPALFPGTPAKLYHNVTGQKRSATKAGDAASSVAFEDASLASGIALKSAAGLGVVSADFTGDAWPDVFVANDGDPNFLWINQRNGTFREEGVLSGVAYDNLGDTQGSMGVAVGDVNSDQALDLFVTNLDGEYNSLYLGAGDGTFQDASAKAGLIAPSYPNTGFGAAMLDVDFDGDLDLFVVNGRVRRRVGPLPASHDSTPVPPFWQSYVEANQVLLNSGNGQFTLPAPFAPDAFEARPAVSRGLATGDVDLDGDLDLLVTVTGGAPQLWRNDSPRHGHWLQIQALDPRHGGRDAYGAQVTIRGGSRNWTGVVSPGASYLSSHDPRLHFGLGAIETIETIVVVWPDGRREQFDGGAVDRVRRIEYGTGTQQ